MGRSLHFINICLLILLISIIFITPETRGLEDNLDNTIVYAVANYGLDTYSQYGSTFVLSEAYWLWTVRGSLYRNDVLEEEGKHVPELADSEPVISADGLNWTIKLKDNLKFASGNPMTAQDVVFTWQTHMTPAIQSPFYFWMIYLFESNSSITKINENTISFVFKQVSQFHYFILSSISIVDFDQYGVYIKVALMV